MTYVFDLTKLDPDSFEHMINMLALKTIGNGLTGFGPGSDAGRDGYFEGTAPYPSSTDQWSGNWYIQSKFHRPQLSGNPQKWLLAQIEEEIEQFTKAHSRRTWPTNWIIATNIDPTGSPNTGSFDKARALVEKINPTLSKRFHIWGGRKILDLLAKSPDVYQYYGHFLTPGHILKLMYDGLNDVQADVSRILRHFLVTQFDEQQYTKLEQAGSTTDNRPGIQKLFTDLPFTSLSFRGMGAEQLAKTVAYDHRVDNIKLDLPNWEEWNRHPSRARVWFIKGGPGQGKSTLTQFICQVQRAALILQPNGPPVTAQQKNTAQEIKESLHGRKLWPLTPRIPVLVELREFAQWYGQKTENNAVGVVTYLAERLSKSVEQTVHAGTLLRMFGSSRWLFVFDGLDEVPSDIKDRVSKEVIKFTNNTLVGLKSDSVIVCTSRPQGYSGQFAALDSAGIELNKLSPAQALDCAAPVLRIDRSDEDSQKYYAILKDALLHQAVQEIMTSPLQAHIMAVVVRDGSRPPDRKWQLFTKFYSVIKQREANRSLPNPSLARVLQSGDKLLKALHNRLGFELHKRAETKLGADTYLTREEFSIIARETVEQLQEDKIDETVKALMEATTERLVLVNTPENGSQIKFDIRPLQEFFSAEYLYESVDNEKFNKRLRAIADDAHWREVMHFLLSALIENDRQTELSIAVQVLGEINGNASEENSRLLARRLAIGSLIATRLLEEGVLDQDRRIRNQFKECIEPILGSTEFRDGLIRVVGIHTKSWLIGLLIRQLTEHSHSESIAATAILLNIVGDDDPNLHLINDHIKKSSKDYKIVLFSLLNERDEDHHGPLRDWVVRILLEVMQDRRWFDLGREGINAISNLLSDIPDQVSRVALTLGIPKPLNSLCSSLLIEYDRRFRVEAREVVAETNFFGLFDVRFFMAPKSLDFKKFSNQFWNKFSRTTGYVRVCYLVFKLASDPSSDNVFNLLESIDNNPEYLELLQDDVFCWIPYDLYQKLSCQNQWRARCNMLSSNVVGRTFELNLALSEGRGDPIWTDFLFELPTFAVQLILDDRPRGNTHLIDKVLKVSENQVALLNGLIREPGSVISIVGYWGKIISLSGKNGKKLRKLISASAPYPVQLPYSFSDVFPFFLNLPEEANLLPHVLNRISEQMMSISSRRYSWRSDFEVGQSAESLVAAFIVNPKHLLDVSENEEKTANERGAAALLYILHPSSDIAPLESLITSIPGFCSPENIEWFLSAASTALKVAICNRNSVAIATISNLFDMAREFFSARAKVQPIIETLREFSRAPVTAIEDDPIWKY